MDGLKELHLAVRSCIRCGEMVPKENKRTGVVTYTPRVKLREGAVSLVESSENPVPGNGKPGATYMWIGESPGEDEDKGGEPFIGRSGKYLKRRLIPRISGIDINDCWFTNLVKCHPENNRDPYASEIKACSSWLDAEIQLVQPKVILAVGKFASQYIADVSLRDGHGQVFSWNGIPVIPLYHPAGVNRAITRKKLEEDYRVIRERVASATNGGSLVEPSRQNYSLIDTGPKLAALITLLEERDTFALDIETNESEYARTRGTKGKGVPDPITNELAGIAISIEDEVEGSIQYSSFYIPLSYHPDSDTGPDAYGRIDEDLGWEDTRMLVCRSLRRVIRSSRIVMHNAKFEMESLDKYELYFKDVWCTLLGAYAIGEETMGLKGIVRRRFDVTMNELSEMIDLKREVIADAPLAKVFPYACADAEFCFRLMRLEEKELQSY
jgi:uracil-DNA glycosylase family 4